MPSSCYLLIAAPMPSSCYLLIAGPMPIAQLLLLYLLIAAPMPSSCYLLIAGPMPSSCYLLIAGPMPSSCSTSHLILWSSSSGIVLSSDWSKKGTNLQIVKILKFITVKYKLFAIRSFAWVCVYNSKFFFFHIALGNMVFNFESHLSTAT